MRQIARPLIDPRHQLIRFVQGRSQLRLPNPGPRVAGDTIDVPEMHVLLERIGAGTTAIRIVYPDKQSERLTCDRNIHLELTRRGLPPEKTERALDHVWNFDRVLIVCDREPAPIALRVDSI